MKYSKLAAISPLLAAVFIDIMAYGLVFPIIAALFTQFDTAFGMQVTVEMRNFLLGLGYSLYPICMLFGAPLLGDLSDIWGRKKTIAFCMTGLSLAFFMMGLGLIWPSIGLFLFGRAFSGLMAGSQPVAQAAIIDLTSPRERALHMSLLTIALNISFIVGPVIGGVFSSKTILPSFGLYTPFFITGALGLASVAWIIWGFRETTKASADRKINLFRPITIFIQAFRNKRLLILSLTFLLMQLGIACYMILSLVLLRETFSYSTLELGMYNAFWAVLNLVTLFFVLPKLLKRFSEGKLVLAGLFLQGIGQLGFLAFQHVEPLLWGLVLIVGPGNIIAFTLMMSLFSHLAGKDDRGWVMGVFGSLIAIGVGISSFSTNLLPVLSSASIIFVGGLLGIFSGLVMIHYLKEYEP